MAIISAFADEIDADPKVQMDTLEAHGVMHIELRGAWDTNVMKLSDSECKDLKQMFGDRGFGVTDLKRWKKKLTRSANESRR